MGICVNKGQKTIESKSKSELRETRNPTQRQRLSVLSVGNEETKHQQKVMEVFSRQSKGNFVRTVTNISPKPTEGKDEQGTVLLFGHKLVIQGVSAGPQPQNGFEDKKLSITGESIEDDLLGKAGIAFTCKKGLKPESPNQDDFCIVLEGETILLGVFDGHGPYGHDVSNYVHTLLPKLITSSETFNTAPTDVIHSSFQRAHEHLLAHCEHPDTLFDCIISGTTASIVIFRERKLMVAHVGDSRVVLAKRQNDALTAVQLTPDHKPTLPIEKARIEEKGGEVKKMPGDIPFRVFVKGKDYPGLSMSRAIGDSIAHDLGVSSEPEVTEYDISDEDEFVLLCSDGVWEFIKNEEAVELIGKYSKSHAKHAAEKLAQLAWTRWLQNEEDVVDDITVVVAHVPKVQPVQ